MSACIEFAFLSIPADVECGLQNPVEYMYARTMYKVQGTMYKYIVKRTMYTYIE